MVEVHLVDFFVFLRIRVEGAYLTGNPFKVVNQVKSHIHSPQKGAAGYFFLVRAEIGVWRLP